MAVRLIAPGRYPDIPNADYHHGPGVSKSHLDDIAPPHSPLHYWNKRLNPDFKPKPKSEPLILGDCIHTAGLEPDTFHSRVVMIPHDAPKAPSTTQLNAERPSAETRAAIRYWTDFQKEHAGKHILKPADYEIVLRCRDRLHSHPLASGLLSGGVAEEAYYAIDPDTGELIKCKVDYSRLEAEGMIVDLKTTEDASPEGFGGSGTKYRYDVQESFYTHVIDTLYEQPVVETFVFIAIEKEPPYAIGVYYVDRDNLDRVKDARHEWKRDLRKINKHRLANHWPDFGEEPQPMRFRRRAGNRL